jgi:hypothetical protein
MFFDIFTNFRNIQLSYREKSWAYRIFLFDTVRTWEISPVWADFDKCHNLPKWNVKPILKIFSDLEPLRSSSNKKTLYSTRSCVNRTFFAVMDL